MWLQNPLEENDNFLTRAHSARSVCQRSYEFPVVLPSLRNNLATLALAKI
jgi:hypothetical protein